MNLSWGPLTAGVYSGRGFPLSPPLGELQHTGRFHASDEQPQTGRIDETAFGIIQWEGLFTHGFYAVEREMRGFIYI